MKKIAILPLILIAVTACATPITQKATPKTAKSQPAKPAEGIWIDVRSVEEYNEGHLQNALNITNADIAQKIPSIAPKKDTPIHLYCRSGRRAEVVRTTLTNLGYTNVTNHGGYEDLLKQGFK